jgi:hypothetical protein
MARNGKSKEKPTKKRPTNEPALARRIEAARRLYGISRADAEAFARIKILPPAVRPIDVSPKAIRKAVRQTMREYYERHAKTLERT